MELTGLKILNELTLLKNETFSGKFITDRIAVQIKKFFREVSLLFLVAANHNTRVRTYRIKS